MSLESQSVDPDLVSVRTLVDFIILTENNKAKLKDTILYETKLFVYWGEGWGNLDD